METVYTPRWGSGPYLRLGLSWHSNTGLTRLPYGKSRKGRCLNPRKQNRGGGAREQLPIEALEEILSALRNYQNSIKNAPGDQAALPSWLV